LALSVKAKWGGIMANVLGAHYRKENLSAKESKRKK
jgi:hypothetical protein